MKKHILIIAGEPSGDMRAGELLKELKKQIPGVSFWGIGGDCMQQEGVELMEHVRQLSIVGVWEAVRNISRIYKQYGKLTGQIQERKPALAILVDYPGFNLRVAKFLHSKNVPVIYYIVPQVWAWGHWRIKWLKNYVSRALVLFKFEEKLLKQAGVNCEFVGHPLMDRAPLSTGKDQRNEQPVITLLPGSRKSEILNIFPLMLEAAEKIHKHQRDTSFVVAESSNISKALYDSALAGYSHLPVSRLTDNTFEALARCDLAIVASGTATLEAAIMEKPMVITYRTALPTFILSRVFMKTAFIGLPNIIAGEEVVPELLQKNATPDKLFRKAMEIMNDGSRIQHIKDRLKGVKYSLGEKGASKRTAEAIKRFMSQPEFKLRPPR